MLSSGELSLTDRKAAIRSLIRSRDLETAEAEVQLLETAHGAATALVLRAELLNAAGEYIAALELFENAFDDDVPSFVVSSWLRQYRLCLRNTADESVALRATTFLQRFAPLSSVNLDEARAILTLAIALDRQDIVNELRSRPDIDSTEIIQECRELVQRGEHSVALQIYLQALEANSAETEIAFEACLLLIGFDRLKECADLVSRYPQLTSTQQLTIELAIAEHRVDVDGAVVAAQEVLSSGELSLTDRKAAIRSLIRSRDLETAEAEVQLLETAHGAATALVLRAELLNAAGEYIAALELFENAFDDDVPSFVVSSWLRQYRLCLRNTADESVALRATTFLQRFAPLSSVNLDEARAILTLAIALDRQDIVNELLSDDRWTKHFGAFAEARAWIAARDGRPQDARERWFEIAERQPIPGLRSLRPGELVRIDDRLIPDGKGEIRLFMMARDEKWRFPWFFAHYRRLGVSRFFVADNGSQDGSVSWLLEQPDTHVFNATTTHAESDSGMVWINAMLDDFGRGGWNLYVDSDEALVFDRFETRDLRALTEHLQGSGFEMAVGPMVDMISPTETRSVPVNMKAEYPFFDPQLRTVPEERCPNRYITGGVRSRMGQQDWLTKIPLTFGPSSIRYLGPHNVTPGTVNTGLVALLHYKFAGDFRERFSNVRAQSSFSLNNIERHESYMKFLEKAGLSVIDTADLQRFDSSADLLSTGIVRKF